jgi:hypothetical protein
MAQTRLLEWKEDDASDLFNRMHLGILKFGVYRGFDIFTNPSGLTMRLDHEVGLVSIKENLTELNNAGITKTKQGVVVIEDAYIDIPVSTNVSGYVRIDLLVIEHEKVQIIGGQTAIYKIIEGTPDLNPVDPALTVPEKQTIIGRLYVGEVNVDLADCTWVRDETPFATDILSLIRNREHQFTKRQKWAYLDNTAAGYGQTVGDATHRCYLHPDYNYQRILVDPHVTDSYILNFVKKHPVTGAVTAYGDGEEITVIFGYRSAASSTTRCFLFRDYSSPIYLDDYTNSLNTQAPRNIMISPEAVMTFQMIDGKWMVKSAYNSLAEKVTDLYGVYHNFAIVSVAPLDGTGKGWRTDPQGYEYYNSAIPYEGSILLGTRKLVAHKKGTEVTLNGLVKFVDPLGYAGAGDDIIGTIGSAKFRPARTQSFVCPCVYNGAGNNEVLIVTVRSTGEITTTPQDLKTLDLSSIRFSTLF